MLNVSLRTEAQVQSLLSRCATLLWWPCSSSTSSHACGDIICAVYAFVLDGRVCVVARLCCRRPKYWFYATSLGGTESLIDWFVAGAWMRSSHTEWCRSWFEFSRLRERRGAFLSLWVVSP